jgi:hypothetical protein
MLQKAGIIEELKSVFGSHNYIWEQDNAPAHNSFRAEFEKEIDMLPWPAKSPDLCPLEQVWNYLKSKVPDRRFSNADALFDALQDEWQKIPRDVIQHFCESFEARLQVCEELRGACLNGSWGRVHTLHHGEKGRHRVNTPGCRD